MKKNKNNEFDWTLEHKKLMMELEYYWLEFFKNSNLLSQYPELLLNYTSQLRRLKSSVNKLNQLRLS